MRIDELNGKKICILGFGREGQAMLRALQTHAPKAVVTLADAKAGFTHESLPVIGGEEYLEEVGKASFDWIIKSPGIPPHPLFLNWKDVLTSSTQIFLDTVKHEKPTVVGITGSKGKSTTTSLIHAMLAAGGMDAHLVGNIGVPSIDYIDRAVSGAVFVLEMSSYQLSELTVSPHVAVITSFFPEHLDYHGTLAAYHEAKRHITRFQDTKDIVFYNAAFPEAENIAMEGKGKKVPFTVKDAPVTLKEIRLLGEHNLGNIAGAYAVAKHFGITDAVALPVIRGFEGLPHRLQSLGVCHGIEWVDDSISTTPESAVAGLRALGDRVRTVILGGQDRGYDFLPLVQELRDRTHVHDVILLPASGGAIRKAAERLGLRTTLYDSADMPAAVTIAKQVTEPGMICLLSPASPSYGFFKNFEERGEKFKENAFGA